MTPRHAPPGREAPAGGPPVAVALDVAWLGNTYGQRWMRTGVYRVVERTATLLAAHPAVQLRLCANEHRSASVAAVATMPALRGVPFATDRRSWAGDRVRAAQAVLDERGFRPPLHVRLARRGLREVHRALTPAGRGGSGAGALTPALLAGAAVYHSTLMPLPAWPRGPRMPRRFLTLYDVIPQRFPDLGWKGADGWSREITGSVRPDDHVLTISQHTRDDLLSLRPDLEPDRVVVTRLAADRDRFYPCPDAARQLDVRRRYGIPDGVPYVLSVGSLVPHKNTARLIAAFGRVVAAGHRDLRLVLTGPKAWAPDALDRALAAAQAPRDKVVLTGLVDDEDLAPLYSGAVAFGFPSLYEGFGLPALEAMQCGTPVVGSNSSSIPEVVGDAGLLVDPADTEALAAALDAVCGDGRLRAQLAARARARAAGFSWERYADAVVAAYRAAL